MQTIRHYPMPDVEPGHAYGPAPVLTVSHQRCQDGGTMCTDCAAQGRCMVADLPIETAPGDLDYDQRSTQAGALFAVALVAVIACACFALWLAADRGMLS